MTRLIGLVLRYRRRPGRHAWARCDSAGWPDPSLRALELADAERKQAEDHGASWRRNYMGGMSL